MKLNILHQNSKYLYIFKNKGIILMYYTDKYNSWIVSLHVCHQGLSYWMYSRLHNYFHKVKNIQLSLVYLLIGNYYPKLNASGLFYQSTAVLVYRII